MIRPPPRSPLFPYTTLFRSDRPQPQLPAGANDSDGNLAAIGDQDLRHRTVIVPRYLRRFRGTITVRSEEHTSELQSLRHLVCRLLLEKKKQNTHTST